jgi:hypothetical protein
MKHPPDVNEAKRLMAALVRHPPKLHDEMKLGKASAKNHKSPAPTKSHDPSAKTKTA